MGTSKPPLTPREAAVMSLVVLLAGPVVAAVACVVLQQQPRVVALWYIGILYLTTGLSWSFLERRTRSRVIRTWNAFVMGAFLLFLVLAVTQEDYAPFPRSGVVLLLLGGAVVAVVMGATALQNFIRWRRGEFDPDAAPPPSQADPARSAPPASDREEARPARRS